MTLKTATAEKPASVTQPALTAGAPALASFRFARPEQIAGKDQKAQTVLSQIRNGLMRWQRAARFRRTLVRALEISSGTLFRNELSCSERGTPRVEPWSGR
jgi:hypothetical protein